MRQKPFVLVVEDDAQLRKVIATNLAARGYFVFQADSFSEAVKQLAVKPQLMILDIHLPDATGWDVAQWAGTVSASAPTIVISGFDLDHRQIERLAPVSFLRKPFDIRQLMDLVGMYAPVA